MLVVLPYYRIVVPLLSFSFSWSCCLPSIILDTLLFCRDECLFRAALESCSCFLHLCNGVSQLLAPVMTSEKLIIDEVFCIPLELREISPAVTSLCWLCFVFMFGTTRTVPAFWIPFETILRSSLSLVKLLFVMLT